MIGWTLTRGHATTWSCNWSRFPFQSQWSRCSRTWKHTLSTCCNVLLEITALNIAFRAQFALNQQLIELIEKRTRSDRAKVSECQWMSTCWACRHCIESFGDAFSAEGVSTLIGANGLLEWFRTDRTNEIFRNGSFIRIFIVVIIRHRRWSLSSPVWICFVEEKLKLLFFRFLLLVFTQWEEKRRF